MLSDGNLLNSKVLIKEEAAKTMVKTWLAQGQLHVIFITRWEYASHIELPLDHEPTISKGKLLKCSN